MRPVSSFLKECCIIARNARCPAIDLYLTYVHWSLQQGFPVRDQFAFVDLLECCGPRYRERDNRAWFKGISILPSCRIAWADKPDESERG